MMGMTVCVVSHKECWQSPGGDWYSSGGFPLQMAAVASLFDSMTLLITRRDAPGEGGIPLPKGAEVVELRKPRGQDFTRKLDVLGNLRYYVSMIARYASKADVVHVPPPGDIPLLGMLVALALRKRLIARYCTSWVTNTETTMMNRVTRGLMRAFAGGRNVMLATGLPGPRSGDRPAPGISWIFATAISETDLITGDVDADWTTGTPLRLVYLGRLAPGKGLFELLDAMGLLWKRLDPSLPRPRLRFVGDGPDREGLESRVKAMGSAGLITFSGQQDRAGVIKELKDADVCVLPSFSEGFSKALLDAMLCSLPVVTTAAGFGPEVVGVAGERGWIVPPGDPRALADILFRLATEPQDWAGLRRRCRSFAEGLTLERWAREIGDRCAKQWHVGFADGKLLL